MSASPRSDVYARVTQAIVDAIEAGTPGPIGSLGIALNQPGDIVHAVAVLEAIIISAETGSPQSV